VHRDRAIAIFATAVLTIVVAAPVAAATTIRSSVKGAGIQAKLRSEEPSVSTNGRYVAFNSMASNLVRNDTNGVDDCFVRDHWQRKTVIVSVSSSGTRGNGKCWGPAISGTGRYVAFESKADNLVPDDTNARRDIFVRDLALKTTEIVSVSSSGEQGNGDSRDPAISADGRYVVFESTANSLVADDTNADVDIFLHDRSTGKTTRVSIGSGGQANDDSSDPTISANGKVIVFASTASNLVPGDTNGREDVFVHVVETSKTSRVSVRSNGGQARGGPSDSPTVSATGRYVGFDSLATNLVPNDTNRASDVFVHDRQTGKTTRVSVRTGGRQGSAWSFDPTLSANGRFVSFTSAASNLVRGDTNNSWDAFVHDRRHRSTKRVSVRSGGGQARGGNSHDVAISGDGRFVTFESKAKNLIPRDSNNRQDVFRRGAFR
jgi:Tol biopolymer transport system component